MAGKRPDDVSIEDLVEGLDDQTIRRLLANAAQSHEDVLRAVRLAGADGPDRLAALMAAVDDGLRARRHLDYWGSSSWAGDAAPVLDALADEVAAEPSAELVELLQRAEGHLVKVIMRADDSNGMIGDLARRVLELHREACAAGVADPQRLAKWMVRFSFEDQDFFEIDPVAYVDALGEKGLAVYRREVASVPTQPTYRQTGRRPCGRCTADFRASQRSMQPNALPSSTATSTGSSRCSGVTCHRRTNSHASPRPWSSWA
ncbi:MAG: hypothetical protein IPH29_06980 [Candidatus Microthrix sp.]|nr:hypothetical protein [Candidatus Microthrix sp.]